MVDGGNPDALKQAQRLFERFADLRDRLDGVEQSWFEECATAGGY